MGFSKEIKEQVFVASARRCCICKEFLGRNIEIHHIIQASEGGEDTYENAIPLCFDCHANAGHYNLKHPRGSKFSPEELRKHRDLWYKLVESGQFSLNGLEISQQFFLTNSFDIVSELVNGDFSNFPINEIKLYQNELFQYLKEIDIFSKRESEFYNYYKSIEDYKSTFPDAKLQTDKYGSTYWTRTPSLSEISDKFFNSEYVANYMIRNTASSADFSKATFTENGCGAIGNYEKLDLKEAKVAFLAIFNSSSKSISVRKIKESFIEDGGFINLDKPNLTIREKNTNDLQLEPGKCLLVPYCILLFSLEDDYHPDKCLTYKNISTGQSQDVRSVELLDGNKSITIGVRNFVRQVQFEQDNFITDYSIKKLDPKNLLLISRFWECGSCPHLFGRKNDSQWEYICEVFNANPDNIQEFVFTPKVFGFNFLKIVEIENEITEIDRIIVDEVEIKNTLKLFKGDEYTIPVSNISTIKIIGKFSLVNDEKYVHDTKMKRQKIAYYIADNPAAAGLA